VNVFFTRQNAAWIRKSPIENQPLSIFFLLPDQSKFQEEVRARAYELYLEHADAGDDGWPEEDWRESEAEIRLSYGMPPRT
jgi:hypothetical protein